MPLIKVPLIVPAGNHKWAVRPKYGLCMKILKKVFSKKELDDLVDRYMEVKRQMLLKRLEE